jgi:hypothetical protein
MEELKRYFELVNRINSGSDSVSDDDLMFIMQFTPNLTESKIDEYVAAKKDGSVTKEQTQAAVIEVGRKLQTEPSYKEKLIKLATNAKTQKQADNLAAGINLFLAGSDIATSINQIREAKQANNRSKRPARPGVPQRDMYLQQALRGAEEGSMDQGRAVAAAQANINDQYQNDIANAKTASTGQAGDFGAYAQLAANRRNRSALELAPIQDQIKRQEQARYDNLLGMRQDETQNIYNNQLSGYQTDLGQYNQDQDAIQNLLYTGRTNLRNSFQNIGAMAPQIYQNLESQRRIRNLRNQAAATYGADIADKYVVPARQAHEDYFNKINKPGVSNYAYIY